MKGSTLFSFVTMCIGVVLCLVFGYYLLFVPIRHHGALAAFSFAFGPPLAGLMGVNFWMNRKFDKIMREHDEAIAESKRRFEEEWQRIGSK